MHTIPRVLPWAGYVRVSHVGGRSGESFRSPGDQADAIRRWAAARREPVDVLAAELDQSGGRADRPILTQAIEGIEAGRYRGLVVAYLSRAGRSTAHLLAMWDRIERAGGQVVAVAENIDTTTPTGRMTRTMLAAIAEHELDQHRDRFALLRQVATKNGVWQRRQTPTGYHRDPATRKLVPDQDAPRVRRAFAQRAGGAAMSQIARDLGMTPSGARALIANRVYLGELHVGEHHNPAAHPAIVSVDEWHAAQHARVLRPTRSQRAPALLAGLARCAGCGHVMSRTTAKVVSYTCHRDHSAGRCEAPAAITARLLDDHVQRIALGELGRLRGRRVRDDSEVTRARAQVSAAQRELDAYLEGVQAAGLDAGQFAAGARRRQEALSGARDTLGQALARRPAQRLDGDPVALWERMNAGQRNHLLGSLIEVVIVQRSGGRGVIRPVADRVRVIRHGAGLIERYPGGGGPMAVRAIVLPDLEDPDVLGVEVAHDAL